LHLKKHMVEFVDKKELGVFERGLDPAPANVIAPTSTVSNRAMRYVHPSIIARKATVYTTARQSGAIRFNPAASMIVFLSTTTRHNLHGGMPSAGFETVWWMQKQATAYSPGKK
jgi:hypothetical protein